MNKRHAAGFTVVELLVVIAIIGILVAMLVPAVQAAREAGRRAQCLNNVKQLGLASLRHLEHFQHFPTGGWGENWVGLPTRGRGPNQPGGWIYNVLPFMEQESLHDLVLTGNDIPGGSAERLRTSLIMLHCPSRRGSALYPATEPQAQSPRETDGPLREVARTDYAINGGDVVVLDPNGGPDTLADAASYEWPDTKDCNGISHPRSEVKSAHVRDGLGNTYLVGEKYLNRDNYKTGVDPGDNATAYSGHSEDLVRWTVYDYDSSRDPPDMSYRPITDRQGAQPEDGTPTRPPEAPGYYRFGSPHTVGWHVVFCDGSGRMINFKLDPQIHRRLGVRDDGESIDQSALD